MALAKPAPHSPDSAIQSALRTLETERDGLTILMEAIGNGLGSFFTAAVETIAAAKGRVIVTGMGKSGHVGRKMAATFASTGTPALYVHPGEASHGDLGMITATDLVLALSNSGETPELADIVAYTRRVSIPLLAIVGRADSTWPDPADLALVLPRHAEACPMGLAPTTSTTATLALGDALAIALLERRGFGTQEYSVLHPGGSLGSLAGIITDGDLRRHMGPDLLGRYAAEIMTAGPKTIRPQALVAEALAMMNQTERPFTVIFVVEERHPIGVVHMHDCLRAGVA